MRGMVCACIVQCQKHVFQGLSYILFEDRASRSSQDHQNTCCVVQATDCIVVLDIPHASSFTVRHVMVLPQHTQHPLLPMPAAELVTNDRIPIEAGLDVGPLKALASSANDGDLIHNGRLTSLVLG